MLLSKDAIADVVESLKVEDFYRPAHATVYSAILDLYGRGEPADAVMVAGELTRSGEIARVGGAAYLHTLVSMVPTAANASYYARIVAEQAVLRRMVTAGTRIVQMGYAAEGEVDDLVDRAQAEVYDLTSGRTSEDYSPLRDIFEGTIERDRGDRLAWWADGRGADRVRRPGCADQRAAPRAAGDHRGTSGDRQVDAGPGPGSVGEHHATG